MKVKDFFKRSHTPPPIQRHELRVASGVLDILADWNGPRLDRYYLLHAALYHDASKIAVSNLNNSPLLREEEANLRYWISIQQQLQKKYNIYNPADELRGNILMLTDAGIDPRVINIIVDKDTPRGPNPPETLEGQILEFVDLHTGPEPEGYQQQDKRAIGVLDRYPNAYDRRDFETSCKILRKEMTKHMLCGRIPIFSEDRMRMKSQRLLELNVPLHIKPIENENHNGRGLERR